MTIKNISNHILNQQFITVLLISALLSTLVKQHLVIILTISSLHILWSIIDPKNKLKIIVSLSIFLYITIYVSLTTQNRHTYLDTLKQHSHQKMTFTGYIEEPQFNINQKTMIAIEKKTNWKAKLIFKNRNDIHNYTYGTKIKVTGTYIPPYPPRNPVGYNPIDYHIKNKLIGKLKVETIEVLDHSINNPFKWLAYKIKPYFLNQHQKALDPPFNDIYTGLIFGVHGTNLPHILKEKFRRVGLLHALVVSGSQVSLVISIIIFLTQSIPIKKKFKWILLVVICILFYFLTGGGASVYRSIIMNLIVYSLKLIKYNTSPLHILALTATCMILINPFIASDYGAQLSFLATASLLYGVPAIEKRYMASWHPLIRQTLAISISPLLFTTPLVWYHFKSISSVALLSNIICLEIIEFLVILGFFSSLLGLIHFNSGDIGHQIGLSAMKSILWIVDKCDTLPFGHIVVPSPNIGIISCIYIIIILHLERKKVAYQYACLMIIIVYTTVSTITATPTITFLDVGQGDATLIEGKHGEVILIDTGPKYYVRKGQPYYNIANNVLIPVLNYKGIEAIDLLIITHFDQDHYGALADLADKIKIKKIIDNGNGNTHLKFQNTIKKHNIPVHTIQQGDQISLNKHIQLFCLSPNKLLKNDSKNNQSLVLKAIIYDITVLFTGDISEKIEMQLSKRYPKKLKSNILKVAHHGSKTSSSQLFLKTVDPEQCIISAGLQNQYNHPHKSVINRLQQTCNIRSTKQNGAIEIKEKK